MKRRENHQSSHTRHLPTFFAYVTGDESVGAKSADGALNPNSNTIESESESIDQHSPFWVM